MTMARLPILSILKFVNGGLHSIAGLPERHPYNRIGSMAPFSHGFPMPALTDVKAGLCLCCWDG
jgi:hypothetical protein